MVIGGKIRGTAFNIYDGSSTKSSAGEVVVIVLVLIVGDGRVRGCSRHVNGNRLPTLELGAAAS